MKIIKRLLSAVVIGLLSVFFCLLALCFVAFALLGIFANMAGGWVALIFIIPVCGGASLIVGLYAAFRYYQLPDTEQTISSGL